MIYSMTGFGRSGYEVEGKLSFNVEIKSINHRYLDINIRMPRMMNSIEDRIRKEISENISRGKIDVFITYNNYEKLGVSAQFNSSLADSYVRCLREIKDRYSDIRDDISISLVARYPDVIYVEENEEDIEEIWSMLKKALAEAIAMLKEMRSTEGNKLREDIIAKCKNISDEVKVISGKAHSHVTQYKAKLAERLKELLDNVAIDENRLNMELAIYADKSSIDEEITRLKSHIEQMKATLDSNEPVGRKLDFIVQEMNRETNTIASKSNDIEITNSALKIKNEIEKIREQIQNIE
ncbi:YicC/YloC family endoribonuclease [Clostridium thermarum]|uniref:YicC/YloC family endoribonuclease n=1 Tax=Clostridium thermarum TaxID=1716543 RepID=UPI00111D1C2A|nr:YicC/YloC family endoribonuclease [Clostridium thermarum]